MRIVRGIAGAFTQAKVNPKQLPEGLSQQILEGSIFSNYAADIGSETVPTVIIDAGFCGDWCSVVRTACENAQGVPAIVAELELAHCDLIAIYEERQVERKLALATSDFESWLDEHDDDVPFMELLIYPIARLKKVIDGNRTTTGRTKMK